MYILIHFKLLYILKILKCFKQNMLKSTITNLTAFIKQYCLNHRGSNKVKILMIGTFINIIQSLWIAMYMSNISTKFEKNSSALKYFLNLKIIQMDWIDSWNFYLLETIICFSRYSFQYFVTFQSFEKNIFFYYSFKINYLPWKNFKIYFNLKKCSRSIFRVLTPFYYRCKQISPVLTLIYRNKN